MRVFPLLPCFLLPALAMAQNTAVVPAIAETLPGNAAVSMPLRWSQGVLQVVVDHSLIPAAACAAGIQGIRLRRPAFLDEPAYAAIARTLTVRAGTTQVAAAGTLQFRGQNQPANLQVVFGPTLVSVPATPALGPGDRLGPQFLSLPFASPIVLPTAADNLFLEFETSDTPMTIDPGNWVDAVQFQNGVDTGYAVPVGNGGCNSRSAPLALQWSGATAPSRGGNASLRLSGAVGDAFTMTMVSLDPQARAAGGPFLGFGADLGGIGLPGCFQWSAPDMLLIGRTSPGGGLQVSFAIPSAHLQAGDRIGAQCAVLDPQANAVGVAFTNGVVLVLDQSGVGAQAAAVFYPGLATPTSMSPWHPFLGLMPVLLIDY